MITVEGWDFTRVGQCDTPNCPLDAYHSGECVIEQAITDIADPAEVYPLDVAATVIGITVLVNLLALCKCQYDATESNLLAIARVRLHEQVPFLRSGK